VPVATVVRTSQPTEPDPSYLDKPTGWWQRLRARLGAPEPPAPPPLPPPPPPGPLWLRRAVTQPIIVPALGHVFDFHVDASLLWRSDGLTREELSDWTQRFADRARRELVPRIGAVAHRYPPHEARALEVELNRLFAGRTWRFRAGAVDLTCRPHVRVTLDDRVQDFVRPYWERRIKMECEHAVEIRRAELAEHLSQQWLAVLAKLRDNPLASGAARMTEKEFAAVVDQIRADQKEAADQLQSLLDTALRNSAGLDAYERAETFDAVIDELRRRAERFAAR
jgi:hypothetical protein